MYSILDFRDALLDYLTQQKELEQEDIAQDQLLTDIQKVEKGLLIKDAIVVSVCEHTYELTAENDNTKLKIGDNVIIKKGRESYNAKVIDTGFESVTIETLLPLHLGDNIDIEIIESVFLDPMISLMGAMDEGKPGAYFLRQLSNMEAPTKKGLGRIDINTVSSLPKFLNKRQLEVIEEVLQRPSVYCIQGPPGTGKTAVLATIANCFSEKRKDVLVIANTHQAVNNALDKIVLLDPHVHPVKISEAIKAEGMDGNIVVAETYNDYLKERKNNKKRTTGDIVGMTLHAAVVNLGHRNSGFQPHIILVDEAGQMPMPYASMIGAFGSGSIVFIGDDYQMPPIFHPGLAKHPFSKSIFEYLCHLYPELRRTLNVTYRMNEEITAYVSQHFYECHDAQQKIIASDYSKNRKFPIKIKTEVSPEVRKALTPELSIYQCDVTPIKECEVFNRFEAQFAFDLAKAAIDNGLSASDIAIVTPFRKQVKMIRSIFHENGWDIEATPLINTVECLQGQDVEMIIISFSATNPAYIKQHYDFIMDSHRVNVMVSRAKTKVVMMTCIRI